MIMDKKYGMRHFFSICLTQLAQFERLSEIYVFMISNIKNLDFCSHLMWTMMVVLM